MHQEAIPSNNTCYTIHSYSIKVQMIMLSLATSQMYCKYCKT